MFLKQFCVSEQSGMLSQRYIARHSAGVAHSQAGSGFLHKMHPLRIYILATEVKSQGQTKDQTVTIVFYAYKNIKPLVKTVNEKRLLTSYKTHASVHADTPVLRSGCDAGELLPGHHRVATVGPSKGDSGRESEWWAVAPRVFLAMGIPMTSSLCKEKVHFAKKRVHYTTGRTMRGEEEFIPLRNPST